MNHEVPGTKANLQKMLEMQINCAETPDASILVTALLVKDYLFFISTAALRLIKQALPCQLKVGVQTDPRAMLGAINTYA